MICPLCGNHNVQTLTEMSKMTYKKELHYDPVHDLFYVDLDDRQ